MEIVKKNRIYGHMAASFSTLIWGVTFISTKILLDDFSPLELIFYRFIFAFILLFILSPKITKPKKDKNELLYMAAGFCGITLYFTFQNVGLTYTLASNAGVIVAAAPMFTAIVSFFMISKSSLHKNFIIGFLITMVGVVIISFNGNYILKLNPLGDILMVMGTVAWAFYCNLLTLAGSTKIPLIQRTRKVFFYGLLFLIPVLFFTDFHFGLHRFLDPKILLNVMFLALAASAISFLTWNYAVSTLGPVKTATYIYFSPIVTVITSIVILHEPFTLISFLGTAFIIIGLVVSEKKIRFNFRDRDDSLTNP
jgi:drug/metabolite transporter (DMT)-like permease